MMLNGRHMVGLGAASLAILIITYNLYTYTPRILSSFQDNVPAEATTPRDQQPVRATRQGYISITNALNLVSNDYFDEQKVNDALDILTATQARQLLTKYVSTVTYKCEEDRRFGHPIPLDGGWNICMDVGIDPKKCIVYSVGISDDWSFDEDVAKFGCNVYSFDPSIQLEDHKHSDNVWFYNMGLYSEDIDDLVLSTGRNGTKHWKVRTLSSIRKMLNHETDFIDVLKFDIEGWEHRIFYQLIESGILRDVKQVSFELHLQMIDVERSDLTLGIYRYLKKAFEQNGFKLWHTHGNEVMAEQHPSTYVNYIEISWINTRFLKNQIE